MSAGTFTLMPGPFTPGIDVTNFTGSGAGAGTVSGYTALTAVVGDLMMRMKFVPPVLVRQAYIRAARELLSRSMWMTRGTAIMALTPVPTLPNNPTPSSGAVYNFGGDPQLEVIGIRGTSIQQTNGTWVNLHTTGQETFDPNMRPDLPNWYSYLPEGMIVYYPAPNLAYNAAVQVIVQLNLNATQIPNDLLAKFNTYLEEGAASFLYGLDKEPWYSPSERDRAHAMFWEGIGSARSWRDKSNQYGSVRATPRPFLSR